MESKKISELEQYNGMPDGAMVPGVVDGETVKMNLGGMIDKGAGAAGFLKPDDLKTINGVSVAGEGNIMLEISNPFKGVYLDTDTLPTTGQAGDFIYVVDTSATPRTATVYEWNGTAYADTGKSVADYEGYAELADAIEGVNVRNAASLAVAIAAVPNGLKKAGLTVTYYDTTVSEWVAKQYVGTDLTGWSTESKWEDVSPSRLRDVQNDIKNITGYTETTETSLSDYELYENIYIANGNGHAIASTNCITTHGIYLTPGAKITASSSGTGIGMISYRENDVVQLNTDIFDVLVNATSTPVIYEVIQAGYYFISGHNSQQTHPLSLLIEVPTYIDGELDNINHSLDSLNGEVETLNGEVETLNGEVETLNGEVDPLINGEVIETHITQDDISGSGALVGYYLNRSTLTPASASNVIITKPIYLNVGDTVECSTAGNGMVLFGTAPSGTITALTTGFTSIKNAPISGEGPTSYSGTIETDGWYVFSGRINRTSGNLSVLITKFSRGKTLDEKLDEKADKRDLNLRVPCIPISVGASKVKSEIPSSPWFDTQAKESLVDYGNYLDDKIDSVPAGESFIFISDCHYDTTSNKVAPELIDYIRRRLGIKTIIHGGDVHNEKPTRRQAADVWLNFNKDFVFNLGSDFKQICGDHDHNGAYTLLPNQTALAATITVGSEVKTMDDIGIATYRAKINSDGTQTIGGNNTINRYIISNPIQLNPGDTVVISGTDCILGKSDNLPTSATVFDVVQSSEGTYNVVSAGYYVLSGLNKSQDLPYQFIQHVMNEYNLKELVYDTLYDEEIAELAVSENWSENDLKEYDAWKKMHYYYDDPTINTRFIVLHTGWTGDAGLAVDKLGVNSLSETGAPYLQMDFLYEALMSLPNDYNVVVCGHNVIGNKAYSYQGAWYFDVNVPEYKGSWRQVSQMLKAFKAKTETGSITYRTWSMSSTGTKTYNFAYAPNVRVAFCIGGDVHWDILAKASGVDMNLSTVEVVDTIGEIAKEGTITSDDILLALTGTDGPDRYYRGVIEDPNDNPNFDRTTDSFQLLPSIENGTITTQTFDIITITSSEIYFTRIGAGEDRVVHIS